MSLYNYTALDAAGTVIKRGNWRGSCTGCYQVGQWVCEGVDTIKQGFYFRPTVHVKLIERLADMPLLQSLVPGLSLVLIEPHDEGKQAIFAFPALDVLPSDQVVTAMRFIKSFGEGTFMAGMGLLSEYEMSFEAQFITAFALTTAARVNSSDSTPSLARLTKGKVWEHRDGIARSYNPSNDAMGLKQPPVAGMLIPLIRGITNPGWQPGMDIGYTKETYVIVDGVKNNNQYGMLSQWNRCGDQQHLSVNHPIIMDAPEYLEGPEIPFYSREVDFKAVAEFVCEKMGY